MVSAITSTPQGVSVPHELGQMLIGIIVVIACIWLFAKALRRAQRGVTSRSGRRSLIDAFVGVKRPAEAGHDTPLELRGRRTIGKGVHLAAIRWCGRELLVGFTGQGVTLLAEGDAAREAGREESHPIGDPVASAGRTHELDDVAAALFPETHQPTLASVVSGLRRSRAQS
jgi:hypothetical protein